MKKTTAAFAALLALSLPLAGYVHAEETMGEKAADTADGAKKDMKRHGRDAKRHVRNATGNGSVTKDIKDGANDAGDEINHNAKKVKNKVD